MIKKFTVAIIIGLFISSSITFSCAEKIKTEAEKNIFIKDTATIGLDNYFPPDFYETNCFDGNILNGWPFHTNAAILASPNVGDVDNDGELEIVIGTYNQAAGGSDEGYKAGYIHLLKIDGKEERGWPIKTAGPIPGTPALADIDYDGLLEIIVGDWQGINIFDYDGRMLDGFPIPIKYPSTPVITDINQNGHYEIVVTSRGGLYIFDDSGSLMQGWPVNLSSKISVPSVGDIDNDGIGEILVETKDDNTIYAFEYNGEIVDGWPVSLQGLYSYKSAPVLGDIDDDGEIEIAVNNNDRLYAFEGNGTIMPGFPIKITFSNTISLGDIDLDGDLEIIAYGMEDPSADGIVYAYHHTGEAVSNFPFYITNTGNIISSFAIGDINDDVFPEILVKVPNRLVVITNKGEMLDGFPLQIDDHHCSGSFTPTPVITDIDKDGDVDLVATSAFDEVYIFGLDSEYDSSNIEWEMFQQGPRHTGFYVWNGDNHRPKKPTITGSENGTSGKQYEYKFLTTDSDGDNIYYFIDWGDGSQEEWIGPYKSGKEMVLKHDWTEEDNYSINVKSKDTHGFESQWADPFNITISKKSRVKQITFLKLIDFFPAFLKALFKTKHF